MHLPNNTYIKGLSAPGGLPIFLPHGPNYNLHIFVKNRQRVFYLIFSKCASKWYKFFINIRYAIWKLLKKKTTTCRSSP